MDQQSTAVSFPIPFSCMSVLSNHLTLAIPGRLSTISKIPRSHALLLGLQAATTLLLQEMISWLFVTWGLTPFLQGECHWSHSSNRNFRSYHAWVRQATPGVEITCLMFPISVSLKRYFSSPWGGDQGFLQKYIILKFKDQDHGGFWTPHVKRLQIGDSVGARHVPRKQSRARCNKDGNFLRLLVDGRYANSGNRGR